MPADAPSPPPLGLAVLWVAATATLCAPLALVALGPPTNATSLPFSAYGTPALAVLTATVATVALAVVLAVSRLGTPTDRWSDRVATAALAGIIAAFLTTAVLTPPDPLTQVVVGVPLVGVALLAAHAVVAFDVDERIRART